MSQASFRQKFRNYVQVGVRFGHMSVILVKNEGPKWDVNFSFCSPTVAKYQKISLGLPVKGNIKLKMVSCCFHQVLREVPNIGELFRNYSFFEKLISLFLRRMGFKAFEPDGLGPQGSPKTQIALTCEVMKYTHRKITLKRFITLVGPIFTVLV